jgi:CheY-like chemotaxis protein
MNLVVNARDAMPRGGKVVIETAEVVIDENEARATLGGSAGPHVMLTVSDTGTGMDEQTLSRIFEPFFTTKEYGKGTGLGLATVFGIVEKARGIIRVESVLGTGTTFRIYFPRVDGVVEATPLRAPAVTLRGDETILLAEDEDQVRHAAEQILRRYGYKVLAARNAGEAMLVCERYPAQIHLLLSDVVMPHMNGSELAARLARTRPDMKVLLMSGYIDRALDPGDLTRPGTAFLQKPITPELLSRKVRELLDARCSVASAA